MAQLAPGGGRCDRTSRSCQTGPLTHLSCMPALRSLTRNTRGRPSKGWTGRAFANRHRIAERCIQICIEALGHKRALLVEQQVSRRCIERHPRAAQYLFRCSAGERPEIDLVRTDPVEKTLSVGQKVGAGTGSFDHFRRDHGSRLATFRGHLIETVGLSLQKKDHAVAIPIAARTELHITDRSESIRQRLGFF